MAQLSSLHSGVLAQALVPPGRDRGTRGNNGRDLRNERIAAIGLDEGVAVGRQIRRVERKHFDRSFPRFLATVRVRLKVRCFAFEERLDAPLDVFRVGHASLYRNDRWGAQLSSP